MSIKPYFPKFANWKFGKRRKKEKKKKKTINNTNEMKRTKTNGKQGKKDKETQPTKTKSKSKKSTLKMVDPSTLEVDEEIVKEMQQKILTYYEQHGRKLPWRETTNKYFILLSEVMLQQTQVSRVIEKYNLWTTKYPTIQDLAKSSLAEVLEDWNGLGFNSRGKRLRDLAIVVTEEYNGEIPSTPEELEQLPGIGPYTARSVLIFSENQDIATVDANIRRILIQELHLPEDTPDTLLFGYAMKCLPKGKSRDWHNALMDYGSTIATAKKTGIAPKTKQSKFEGSRRYYRAEALRRIRKNNGKLSRNDLEDVVKNTRYSVDDVITGLVKDDIVHWEDDVVVLNN